MTHPNTEQLLQHAVRAAPGGDIGWHLESCAECRAELAAITTSVEALRAHAGVPSATAHDCLDDASVAALADGSVREGERGSLVTHLARCPACRIRVASVTRALGAEPIAAELTRARALHLRARGRGGLLLAGLAAAVALIVLVRVPPGEEQPTHRGATVAVVGTPMPRSPLGAVATVTQLRWSAVPGADRYRVTLFDRAGNVVHEAVHADTVLALPAVLELDAGDRYYWKVEARTGWDRWTPSELVEFSIPAGRRP